jgi:hypothetical protein
MRYLLIIYKDNLLKRPLIGNSIIGFYAPKPLLDLLSLYKKRHRRARGLP